MCAPSGLFAQLEQQPTKTNSALDSSPAVPLSVPKKQQARLLLRPFTVAVPSVWNVLSPHTICWDLYILHPMTSMPSPQKSLIWPHPLQSVFCSPHPATALSFRQVLFSAANRIQEHCLFSLFYVSSLPISPAQCRHPVLQAIMFPRPSTVPE